MYKRKRPYYLYVLLLIYIILSVSSYIFTNNNLNYSHDNTLVNLSKIEFDDMVLINLSGSWEASTDGVTSQKVDFPTVLKDADYPASSFSLDLILPETDCYYALMLPSITRGYSVSINDSVIFTNINKNGQMSIPKNEMMLFYADTQNIHLTITVDDEVGFFQHSKAQVYIGFPLAAQNFSYIHVIPILLLLVLFVLSSIYYFSLYINNRKHREYLTFSILCLILTIRAVSDNTAVLFMLFPFISLPVYLHIDAIIVPSLLVILTLHEDILFPKQLNKKWAFPVMLILLIHTIATSFFPSEHMILTFGFYLIISYAALIILIITAIKAFIQNEPSSESNLSGILLVTVGVSIDNYLFVSYNHSTSFLLIGFSVYIILQIEAFLSETVHTYNNENYINDTYSSAIIQLEKEETNFLSSHLKPHFLFNALNIISGYALFDQAKAKEITKALITYLRQLFEHDNLNEMNTIENEMSLVKAFAYIELERFPGLTISYDIPDELPDVMLPSLTLQPLLENAINHGVRKKNSQGDGNVVISIRCVKNYVYFTIKDDGAGQDENKLKEAITVSHDGKFHSLIHISYRLKKLYNEKITVRSISGVGTFISFKIPYNSGSNSNL